VGEDGVNGAGHDIPVAAVMVAPPGADARIGFPAGHHRR